MPKSKEVKEIEEHIQELHEVCSEISGKVVSTLDPLKYSCWGCGRKTLVKEKDHLHCTSCGKDWWMMSLGLDLREKKNPKQYGED